MDSINCGLRVRHEAGRLGDEHGSVVLPEMCLSRDTDAARAHLHVVLSCMLRIS